MFEAVGEEYWPTYFSRIRDVLTPGGRAGLMWDAAPGYGQHCADTLAEWGRRFEAARGEIRRLGFDERFRKMWRYDLSSCEAGFRTERTNVVQLAPSRV